MKYVKFFMLVVLTGLIGVGCAEAGEKKLAFPDDLPEFVLESDFDIIDWERQAGEFDGMVGNQNMVGVIGADMPSLNGQKWMWHLWGIDEVLGKELTVVGYHKETETIHPILTSSNDSWSVTLAGENNGADAHTPSSVKFTEPGEWALLLYVNEELFDIIVLNINE